jgi:DmsE family decaheme c-type cytochrome
LATLVAAATLIPLCAPPAISDEPVGGNPIGKEQAITAEALSEGGADTCLSCHNDESMQVIFRTPHGQQADPESPMAQLQCEQCHGAGDDHAGRRATRAAHQPLIAFGATAQTPVETQNEVCMDCHTGDVSLAWAGSVHERNDTGCVSCHRIHVATDPVGLHSAQNEVCFECHRKQQADARKPSAHPLRTDHPVRVAAMVCTDCHSPHASVASGQLKRNTLNELCFDCHAEFRGPVLFDHAPVSEDCSLCHRPHGSIHPALLTRRAPLLCQSCHSQRGHPSVSFTPNSLPGNDPSAMILERSCMNCHTQVHGSNHPSGFNLMR